MTTKRPLKTKVQPIRFKRGGEIEETDPDIEQLDELLPKPVFRILFNGPSGIGKSEAAKFFLCQYYKKFFDEIHIFCPTILSDRTLKDLVIEDEPEKSPIHPDNVYTTSEVSEIVPILNNLHDRLQENAIESPFYKSLVIFDDLSGELAKNSAVTNLFTRGRKANICIFIMSNKYKTFNPTIRNNLTHLAIFKPSNSGIEVKSIIEEMSGGHSAKAIENMMQEVYRNEPRGFVFIDKRAAADKMFRHGIDKYITPD